MSRVHRAVSGPHRARVRAVVLACVLALGAVIGGDARAAVLADRRVPVGAGTGSWSVAFGTGSGLSGALAVLLIGDSFHDVTNQGTAILGTGFDVTLSVTTSGGAVAQLATCSGTWNEAMNTCSGTITLVASTGTPGGLPAALVGNPGQAVRVRLHPTSLLGGTQTATLSASVRRH